MNKSRKVFDRAEHCRRIASKGGRATVKKYGAEHMRKIGRKGFESTTERYFNGSAEAHKGWLAWMGLYVYWRDTGIPMKRDAAGYPIWPEKQPDHPAHTHVNMQTLIDWATNNRA